MSRRFERFRGHHRRSVNIPHGPTRVERAKTGMTACEERGHGQVRFVERLRRWVGDEVQIVQARGARYAVLYAIASVLSYFVDVCVLVWTLHRLTTLTYAAAVPIAAVVSGGLSFCFHFLLVHVGVDHDSEPTTRRGHLLAAAGGAAVAVAACFAIRSIAGMDGQVGLEVVHRAGWVPFALLNLACPFVSGCLSSLFAYYSLPRRHLGQLDLAQSELKQLGELYHELQTIAATEVPVFVEHDSTPAWLLAERPPFVALPPWSGHDRLLPDQPVSAHEEDLAGLESEVSPEDPPAREDEKPRRRRGRPPGSKAKRKKEKEPPAADPFDGVVPESGGNGDGFAEHPMIPPVVRGLVGLLLCIVLPVAARAACAVGADATASGDLVRLRAATDSFADNALEFADAFGCDALVLSQVLDEGPFTPRRRIAVPTPPALVDCANAPDRERTAVEEMYRGFKNVDQELASENRTACERDIAAARTAYTAAAEAFKNEVREVLTVRHPRNDTVSALAEWFDASLNGTEAMTAVVLISDGRQNPPWSTPRPRFTVPPGTATFLVLVPPQDKLRRAFPDALVWRDVFPGIHLVPDAELRPGLFRQVARGGKS